MGNKDAMNYLIALMNREISTRDKSSLTARDVLDSMEVLGMKLANLRHTVDADGKRLVYTLA